jgi:hypothetical protein
MLLRAILAGVLLCGAAQAQDVVSPRAGAITVTLYHDDELGTSDLTHPDTASGVRDQGLAFITETRVVDLPAGPATIHFRGVASTIVPQTADVQGLPAGVAERNFDYDLLSPGSLLAKSIGKTVHLVRRDPRTGKRTDETAIIRSGPAGVMLEIDGKLEALRCSGLPEKLVLDSTPDGLTDTPTLSLRTMAPASGRYTVTLSYIATGLNWSADYVAHIRPGGRTLDLTGWVTLANFSETSFGRVPVQVVAGLLNSTGEDKPVDPTALALSTQCWPTDIEWGTRVMSQQLRDRLSGRIPQMGLYSTSPVSATDGGEVVVVTGSRIPDPRALGDYKIYTLPEPTTLSAMQTKQVQFLDRPGVAFDKVYRYAVDPWSGPPEAHLDGADILLRLKNKAETGLGKPLPAGTVSVMEPARGGLVFAGQDAIRDTAVGLPVEIQTGHALDVTVTHRVTLTDIADSGAGKHTLATVEATVENDKPIPVQFELQQSLDLEGSRIASESREHTLARGSAVWSITLKPGERVTVDYTLELPTP